MVNVLHKNNKYKSYINIPPDKTYVQVSVDKGSETTKLTAQVINTECIHSVNNVDVLAVYSGMYISADVHMSHCCMHFYIRKDKFTYICVCTHMCTTCTGIGESYEASAFVFGPILKQLVTINHHLVHNNNNSLNTNNNNSHQPYCMPTIRSHECMQCHNLYARDKTEFNTMPIDVDPDAVIVNALKFLIVLIAKVCGRYMNIMCIFVCLWLYLYFICAYKYIVYVGVYACVLSFVAYWFKSKWPSILFYMFSY